METEQCSSLRGCLGRSDLKDRTCNGMKMTTFLLTSDLILIIDYAFWGYKTDRQMDLQTDMGTNFILIVLG